MSSPRKDQDEEKAEEKGGQSTTNNETANANNDDSIVSVTTALGSFNMRASEADGIKKSFTRTYDRIVSLALEIRAAINEEDKDWPLADATATALIDMVSKTAPLLRWTNKDKVNTVGPQLLVAYSARAQAAAVPKKDRYRQGIQDSTIALEIIEALEGTGREVDEEERVVVLNTHAKCLEYQYDDERNLNVLSQATADYEKSWRVVEEHKDRFGQNDPNRDKVILGLLSVKVKERLANVGLVRPVFTKNERKDIERSLKLGAYRDDKHFCKQCGKNAEDLLLCGGCNEAWYCNRSCQRRAWKQHKRICRPQWERFATFLAPVEVKNEFDSIQGKDSKHVYAVFKNADEYKVILCDPETGQYFDAVNDCRVFFKCESDLRDLAAISNSPGRFISFELESE